MAFSPADGTYLRRSQLVVARYNQRVTDGVNPELADLICLREFIDIDRQMLADRCCELQDEVEAFRPAAVNHRANALGFAVWLFTMAAIVAACWRWVW